MKITLIGDLQYGPGEQDIIRERMSQVGALNPDFAVIMGDFGGPNIATRKGYEETKEFAAQLGCPYHVIFGNHDVEYYPGGADEFDPTGTYREFFGTEPHNSLILNGVLFLILSVERQPEDMMRTVHGVYVSDEQYEWVEKELKAHSEMPTVIIAHAPVVGSGLRCFRPMHTSSQDTYLDQTYKADRWPELLKNNPQIKAWCSAHFHMGHDYDTAITEKYGVTHISCGTMIDSRDGSFLTRILDVTADKKLIISTLDHIENTVKEDAVIDLTGKENPAGNITKVNDCEIFLGDDTPVKCWSLGRLGRYYIATEKGLLWEYHSEFNEFVGALIQEGTANEMYSDGDRLVIVCADKIFSVNEDTRDRFDVMGSFSDQNAQIESAPKGTPLSIVEFTTRETKYGKYISLKI